VTAWWQVLNPQPFVRTPRSVCNYGTPRNESFVGWHRGKPQTFHKETKCQHQVQSSNSSSTCHVVHDNRDLYSSLSLVSAIISSSGETSTYPTVLTCYNVQLQAPVTLYLRQQQTVGALCLPLVRPSVRPCVVRTLTAISRDAISLYSVNWFQRNLTQIFKHVSGQW